MSGADVVPVPAATVAMVRDDARGLRTWMMRRVRAMAFAAGPPSSLAAGSIRRTPTSMSRGPAHVPTRPRPGWVPVPRRRVLFPSGHLPAQQEAAIRRYTDVLERHVQHLETQDSRS
jgi:hypothetical protein